MKNKLKLKFKENFSGYLSIKKKFEISDFSELNIITGINGSGKTHFLKAIERGDIEAEYNSEKILPQHIKFFDYNSFKLENEKVITSSNFIQEKNNFLNKLCDLVWSHGMATDKRITEIERFNSQEFWEIMKRKLKTTHKFFSVQKLAEMNNTSKLDEVFRQNYNVHSEYMLRIVKSKFSSLKNLRIDTSNLHEEYFISPEEDILKMKDDKINQIVLAKQPVSFLEQGFGEIFKKYTDILDGYIKNNKNMDKTHGQLIDDCKSEYGSFPWDFANEMFKKYSEESFVFKYKFEKPMEIAHEGIKANLINGNEENIDFENLSSGEKMLLALTLFLYKSKINRNFPKLLLLDEIDVTLHPSMCKKVIEILKEIFVENGIKIILTTHNPSLVAACDSVSDGIFVKTHDGIEREKISDAINILSDGLVTLNDLLVLERAAKNQIIVFSEGKNYNYFNKAAQFYDMNKKIYFAKITGHFGDTNLRTMFNVFKQINNSRKIFYIWDCDYIDKGTKEKTLSNDINDYNIPIILPLSEKNKTIMSGIENMIPKEFCNLSNISKNKKVKNEYKDDFFNALVNKKEVFSCFENVFTQILDETSKDTQEQKNKNKNNNPFDIIKV